MEKERVLCARLFGGLTLSGLGGELTMESLRSPMLTKLLAYFLCHHKDKCMIPDLIEQMWPEGDSDNPEGALKNLVYRLRGNLKRQWPDAELLKTGKGFYQWNPQYGLELDVERFEDAARSGTVQEDEEQKIALCLQAAELFSGPFLAGMRDTYWIAALTTYYDSLFLTTVKTLCALLDKRSRYEEMERICKRALKEDPLEEQLYYFFIKALFGQEKYHLALEQYQKASDIIYDNLGVRLSEQTQRLYHDMMVQMHDCDAELEMVLDELQRDTSDGAFLCDFGVFRQIFQLQQRRAGRLGISNFLMLVTVVPRWLASDSERYRPVAVEATHTLNIVLMNSLRSGDVISRYSDNQYIIMLPTCQYESAKKVQQRIFTRFSKEKHALPVELKFELSELV